MQELIVFNNDLFGDVRFIEVEGKPYAIGIDIAIALGYSNASKAVSTHCKNRIKELVDVSSQNGNPHSKGVNETLVPTNGGNQIIKKKM